MADSPPKPMVQERSIEELLEDLCTELRYVAVSETALPYGQRVISHISNVREIHAELAARKADYHSRIVRLTQETQWQTGALLDDCLAYPEKLPFVRDLDGIHRLLRCRLCCNAERPADAEVLWFCEECMQRVLGAIQNLSPIPGILLFRVYNPEARCSHADNDTVVATSDDSYADAVYGVCEKCVSGELKRRQSTKNTLI